MLHEDVDGEGEGLGGGEDEGAQATLESVEEMLEGYEWASDDILGRRALTGTAEQIEARLLDELMALDKVGPLMLHTRSATTYIMTTFRQTFTHS